MKQSIGVFGWNVAKLCACVSDLEKNGDRVVGYEVGRMDGYPFEKHDRLVFLEYSPELLEVWRAKGDIGDAEIVIPEEPRKFGDPIPATPPAAPDHAHEEPPQGHNAGRRNKNRRADPIVIEE